MKNAYKTIVSFLRRYWYFLLLIAAGSLAIGESIRITKKYHPSNWLTGPSGFIMILGLVLVALLLFEIMMSILRAKRRAKKRASQQVSLQEVQEQEASAPAEEASEDKEEKLYTRNMWLSFGLLIVYTLLIKVLGFAISSALYLLVNLLLLKNSWKTTLITVAVILIFLLFVAPMLSMSFPRGLFGI